MAEPPRRDVHTDRVAQVVGLLWVLSRKNFQVRYKRAVLGVGWAMAQPAIQAAVLAFVFLRVIRVEPTEDYALFVLSGVLPWAFFAQGLSLATASVVENGPLVKKVAIPKVLFPAAAVGGAAIAFTGSLFVLVVACVVSGNASVRIALLVPAVLFEAALVVALGVFASAFNVAYRDVRYIVESGIPIAFYATPIVYAAEQLDGWTRQVVSLNPMTGILSLYRAAIVGRPVGSSAVVVTAVVTAIVALAAAAAFRSKSPEFADLL